SDCLHRRSEPVQPVAGRKRFVNSWEQCSSRVSQRVSNCSSRSTILRLGALFFKHPKCIGPTEVSDDDARVSSWTSSYLTRHSGLCGVTYQWAMADTFPVAKGRASPYGRKANLS